MSNNPKDRIKNFLQQKADPTIINKSTTPEERKEFIYRKLFKETPSEYSNFKPSFSQRLLKRLDQTFKGFQGRGFNTFMRETLPFLSFICFSTYIIYKMETKQDEMWRSVIKVKSMKQEQIEKEDEYIKSALKRKTFGNNQQIQDVPDRKMNYKFEDMDEMDEDGDMNTREDFLEALRKDYNKGQQIPEEYRTDVFQYAQKNGKLLGFNQHNEKEEENEDIRIGLTKQQQNSQRNLSKVQQKQ